MRANIKTIRLSVWLSVVLSIITYLITIKDNFRIVNCRWLPDSFLLTTFGGAFASMLVVLICEISKYIQNKEGAETYIFSHLCYLYGQILILSRSVEDLIKQEDRISENSLDQNIANIEAEMNAVFYTDYAPYKKNNLMLKLKQEYNETIFQGIQTLLQHSRVLKMAVLEDKITETEIKMGVNKAQTNYAGLVLAKLSNEIREQLISVDTIVTKVDQYFGNKYNWLQIRNGYFKIPNNRNMLEQYLSKKNEGS